MKTFGFRLLFFVPLISFFRLEHPLESEELLARDLLKMQEDPKSVSELCSPPSPGAPDSADEEPATEPATKAAKCDSCSTLWQVLDAAGLVNFTPKPDDSERMLLARLRRLTPHIRSLNRTVRLAEDLLSPATIHGRPRRERPQNRWEHLLARLREKCLMSAKNQARMQLWSDYSTRCVAAAQPKNGQKQVAVAMPLTALRPCWEPGRSPQVLVCRPLATGIGPLNGVRLAITLAVWRAGKGDRKALNGKGPVAMNQARLVQVLLLTPVQTEREPYTFEASPLGVHPEAADLFP